MSFTLPDLVIESVLREGLLEMRTRTEDRLNVIFNFENLGNVGTKYNDEIEKLTDFFLGNSTTNTPAAEIAVVHSFSEVQTKSPCISIQLSSDIEDRTLTMLEDFGGIDEDNFDIGATHSNIQIMLGVHTKDALITKYLYTIVKYILLSKKEDLINRCLINMSYSGSDFTRNLQYKGDIIFDRFLTVSGRIEDNWKDLGEDPRVFPNFWMPRIAYLEDDVVIYEDILYEAVNDILAPGPTDPDNLPPVDGDDNLNADWREYVDAAGLRRPFFGVEVLVEKDQASVGIDDPATPDVDESQTVQTVDD